MRALKIFLLGTALFASTSKAANPSMVHFDCQGVIDVSQVSPDSEKRHLSMEFTVDIPNQRIYFDQDAPEEAQVTNDYIYWKGKSNVCRLSRYTLNAECDVPGIAHESLACKIVKARI
jgi:hypothetical protein